MRAILHISVKIVGKIIYGRHKKMKLIKTKEDCKEFLDSMEAFGDYWDCRMFTYDCYSGTHGWNCVTALIYNGNWNVFSYGLGWSDVKETLKTYDEMIEYVWKDKKYINKELKRKEKQNVLQTI